MGFEPTIPVSQYTGLANRRLQPLGHPSNMSMKDNGPFYPRDEGAVNRTEPSGLIVDEESTEGFANASRSQGRPASGPSWTAMPLAMAPPVRRLSSNMVVGKTQKGWPAAA